MTNKFGPGTCVVCGCNPSTPYRRHAQVDGRLTTVEGCVARAHNDSLAPYDLAWHNRPQAKALRAATAKHERSIFGGRLGAAVRAQ